jgi:hypothetical protein
MIALFWRLPMNLPLNVASEAAALASPVVELRQYTLRPGQRETLITLFDREFIESQEATGMTIIGQFRDLDRPDMFVWLRGFDGMDARKEALNAFYGGPIWAAHRDVANATMIDSDDVLLLRPAWPGAGFDLSGLQRPVSAERENSSDDDRLAGIVVIQIHHLRPGAETEFADRFAAEAAPTMTAPDAASLPPLSRSMPKTAFRACRSGPAKTSLFPLPASTASTRTHAMKPPWPHRQIGRPFGRQFSLIWPNHRRLCGCRPRRDR